MLKGHSVYLLKPVLHRVYHILYCIFHLLYYTYIYSQYMMSVWCLCIVIWFWNIGKYILKWEINLWFYFVTFRFWSSERRWCVIVSHIRIASLSVKLLNSTNALPKWNYPSIRPKRVGTSLVSISKSDLMKSLLWLSARYK